ncbi:tRNA modification GTPase MnmE [Candidatus Photodesmus blepharus]|uniref:tRNA modification GTPase MnmE n=1 Tax=Candidatus Photodesmus blepharonis TaxID=1179155 RepID=A0A084CNP5_9GAMM|nr:tRNA uridine-5-carboxymethylaminomethyl(34) synthesis GTPase MnmE [Candidatus Photodesmus blepharus]KEY91424.1 tRNA modification GTPase MnmE [Candidatus Photodesmus blepharus]
MTRDTIVAPATSQGRAGIGIVRISGPKSAKIALKVTGKILQPRYAEYLSFKSEDGAELDKGIALYFPGPYSFTGEDVLELQGHGSPVMIDMLINRILKIPNVRLARPGEFSERAFLNGKIDLIQAEAIADLINATSKEAARSAFKSFQGEFSKRIQIISKSLINLRIHVEAIIDFPEETIDLLDTDRMYNDLQKIIENLEKIRQEANQGIIIRDGMQVVIAGLPNAGKSSLLNALSGKESAIVTEIPGTTRDILREHIHIDGMPLHILDTAGLCNSSDPVEKIGVERAWKEIKQADQILFVIDAISPNASNKVYLDFIQKISSNAKITIVRNKIDQTDENPGISHARSPTLIRLSAKTGEGIDTLKKHFKERMNFLGSNEGNFMARRRHIDALEQALRHLHKSQKNLSCITDDILAEELRISQQYLNEITGKFSSDDLLEKIFSSFCIGK